jgi:enoyl-CoA hydratase
MSNFETIVVEKRESVAILTINRPEKMNSLNTQVMSEIISALSELENDTSVRVLVITGTGEKSFIAGADISEFAGRTSVSQRAAMSSIRLSNAVENFSKPVIAMINGFCLGGGNELAMACDLRYASEKARFGQPEINLGIIPGDGGTQRLTRLIGEGKAMEWILTGDIYNAQTAVDLGLINAAFPPEELEAKTMEIAQKIAEKSPIALRFAKEAVKIAAKSNLDEGLRREVDLFAICFSSKDKEEGINAFLEKRKAAFSGE